MRPAVAALSEVSEFFEAMSKLFEGWDERVKRVGALLRSKQSAFVLVATPEEQVLAEAEYFCSRVEEHSISLSGVIFNRVQNELAPRAQPDRRGEPGSRGRARAIESAGVRRRLVDNFLRYETQARGDQLRIEAFRVPLSGDLPVATIPNFDEDLHDLNGLRRVREYLQAAG